MNNPRSTFYVLRVSTGVGSPHEVPRAGQRRLDLKKLHSARKEHAFTLIEIMITVGLLTFMILGLLAMFNQTQRAFRTSMTQSDVLEAGRATIDLLARELSEMTPSQSPDMYFNGVRNRATNFFAEPAPFFVGMQPLLQGLPGMPNNVLRTNTVQRFFFLTRVNQDWIGNGYEVLPENPGNPLVGTLYRFSATNTPRTGFMNLSRAFQNASRVAYQSIWGGVPITNLHRIADGIVHLRVRAYANNGFLVITNQFRGTNSYARDRSVALPNVWNYTNAWNTIACADAVNPDQSACYFMSNALPAYVDVELGILEPQILQRYRSIPVPAVQRQYLSNHVAQVHLFHQRVAIPNVDPTAYP